MNLLISAYACEPNKGSEPEVGWRWVVDLSKKYERVTVVTRKNNRPSIEDGLKSVSLPNVQFLYFDLSFLFLKFKKVPVIGTYLYAYLWEMMLPFFICKHFKFKSFDFSQRVTFVSYKFPSMLWLFSKKFILGPIAGGERYPIKLITLFSLKGKISEVIRFLLQRAVFLDPFILLTLWKADEIIAVTSETRSILPQMYRSKVQIEPAISVQVEDFKNVTEPATIENGFKFLFVGRLLEWKGLGLLIKALGAYRSEDYVLDVVGEGDATFFKKIASKAGANVRFHGAVERSELSRYYISANLFVFPSLHDSGGMVVLEAKEFGLPVIVTSYGGPKYFVGDLDHIVSGKTEVELIANLREKIDLYL